MVKRASAVAAIVAVLACGAGAAGGRSSARANQTANGAEALERAIAQELSSRGGVGATVAVVQDGRPLLAKGFGRRSADSPAGVDESTLFGMGSVTKQFTAAAALLLAEQGKLSVNDKVAKYYPGLTRANDITLLDLMNHVSGYPDYYPLDFVDRRMLKPIDPDELIRRYAGAPLDFEPGTRWSVLEYRLRPAGTDSREGERTAAGILHAREDLRAARHDPHDLRPEGGRPSGRTGLHVVRLDEAHTRGSRGRWVGRRGRRHLLHGGRHRPLGRGADGWSRAETGVVGADDQAADARQRAIEQLRMRIVGRDAQRSDDLHPRRRGERIHRQEYVRPRRRDRRSSWSSTTRTVRWPTRSSSARCRR